MNKPIYKVQQVFNILRTFDFLLASLLVFLLITSSICKAQIELSNFNGFSFYTQENGLPSTYITDIREDKHGFLWIGTANGVSRYDGNQFTNFTHFSDNSVRHKFGFINSLIMDKSGETILVACDDGIFYTSIDTINFQNIEEKFPQISNSPQSVTDLFLDQEKKLWSASNKNGLHLYDLEDRQHNQFLFKETQYNTNSKLNSLQCIISDPGNSNILWIGSLAGVIQFNIKTKEYKIFVYDDAPELAQNSIRRIHVSETEVFLGTWKKGVVIFDKQTEEFKYPLIPESPSSYSLILEMYQDLGNNLWITSGDGLIRYDTKAKKVGKVSDHNTDKGLVRGVSFVDSRNIIWFGFGKGFFKYDPLNSPIQFIQLEDRNEIQNPLLVREIIRSNEFIYVAGQYSSGLYKIDLSDGSFEVIRIPMFDYHNKVGYQTMDMAEMDDGNFVIISGKKIAIYNPQTQLVKLSPLQINHPNPSLQSVVKDRDNNYWIGGREGGLYCMNFEANTLINYKEEFNEFRDENHRWINKLFIDSNNKLWIGKGSSSVMDLNNYSLSLINPDHDSKITTYTDVVEFYEDKDGRVWMAGASNGLGFTNFENFNKGLSHKADGYFSGVFAYNDSLLWTIGRGLGIFNINTMSYDDIKLSSDNRKLRISGPVISAGNSDFVVGCDNGVLFYNPEKQQLNKEIPIPYIRAIESAGKTLYRGNNLSPNDFSFDIGTKQLVFKISSLGFHFSDQIKYQYRFEDDWQNIGVDKEINLTNLSYGKYKLQIRAINNQGKSLKEPAEYLINIPSPWWLRWWAFLIYLVITLLLADRFYRFQLSKRLAIAETVKLKEINKLRTSFYTNITHEFRTPLTVILGMVDSLKSTFENKKIKSSNHSLEMIERNGKNLLHLVNKMLELSKLESGKSQLILIQADVIPFIKYLCESFYALASEKQINLTVYTEVDELLMDFDANKLTAIISNILSNAIKFTQSGGKIIVHINQVIVDNSDRNSNENKSISIKIKDNGQGIAAEELNNIFNRFYQIDNDSSRQGEGTGIGLTLTKELVELMNGSITVKSKLENGSEFTILLPIHNRAEFTKHVHNQLGPSYYASANEPEELHINAENNLELPLALIIEDNADVAHYLETCMTGKYQTMHASAGDTGIETAFEEVPDIIICDVMMPGKNGFEVCKALKSDERTDHIPVILLTAKATLKDKLTGLSHGAEAYLTKPFVKAELLTRLDQLVLSRKKLLQKINDDTLGKILKKRTEDPETKFLQKIIKIIHDETGNHSFGSSVQLARKMHLSESQIYRKLKAITGKSTAVFIRSVRLQKAKELLQTSDKSISEIAYEVGFNDPSWFSRAFKEEFGYAPSAISK